MFSITHLRKSVLSVLYHDHRSGMSTVQKLMGETPHKTPPIPTSEDLRVAEAIVERVLYVMYDIAIGESVGLWKGVPSFKEAFLDEFVVKRSVIQV